VEHVERQDEREQEIRSDADELEQAGDQLEERGKQLDQQVDELRDDWEQKSGSADTPGAQPGEGLDLTDAVPEEDATPEEDE
jgi:hypothetical protein